MKTTLSDKQKAEIVSNYEKCGSTLQAWRMFKVKHKLVSQHIPNPCHKSITRWVKNFKDTGSVNGGVAGHKMGRSSDVVTENLINEVKIMMRDNPKTPIRAVATRTNTSVGTAQKIVRKKLKLFPYKIKIVQKLEPIDRPNRQFFAHTMLTRSQDDPNYVKKIGFTDESAFSLAGVCNRHNCRIWGSENPHVLFEKPRVSPKVHIW